MELLILLTLSLAELVAGTTSFVPVNDVGGFNLTYAYHGLYFSAAAYCSQEQISYWNCGSPCAYDPGFTPLSITEYEMYGETNQVLTGFSDSAQKFIIAFQGTRNPEQLVEEGLGSVQDNAQFYPGQKTYMIHKYFWEAYNGLRGVRQKILEEASPYANSDCGIFITGHSLGGALASICAFDLSISGKFDKDRIMKYTFGEPRVGDPEWATDFDIYVPHAYRVVHWEDVVPHLPHFSTLWYEYLHPSQEIFYNESFTNYTECGVNEDENCCNSMNVLGYNINDHLSYFDYPISRACDHNPAN